MSLVTLPRAQIPLTLNGNAISAEWYRWAHDITIRAGGVDGSSNSELAMSQFEDAGIEETKALLYSLADDVRQGRAEEVQTLMDKAQALESTVSDLVAAVAELSKAVEALSQGTLQ